LDAESWPFSVVILHIIASTAFLYGFPARRFGPGLSSRPSILASTQTSIYFTISCASKIEPGIYYPPNWLKSRQHDETIPTAKQWRIFPDCPGAGSRKDAGDWICYVISSSHLKDNGGVVYAQTDLESPVKLTSSDCFLLRSGGLQKLTWTCGLSLTYSGHINGTLFSGGAMEHIS
jgi:hypothetical protein